MDWRNPLFQVSVMLWKHGTKFEGEFCYVIFNSMGCTYIEKEGAGL